MDDITKQSQRETGGSAFPVTVAHGYGDVLDCATTLRDYFAAAALTGLAAANMPTCAYKADIAFDLADAMLAERERRTNQPQPAPVATQDKSTGAAAAPDFPAAIAAKQIVDAATVAPGRGFGIDLIQAERCRQVVDKGFDAAHDDLYADGSILQCAIEVLRPSQEMRDFEDGKTHIWGPGAWPFERARHIRKKYGDDHVHQLVIAGAMIAAEIDRLDRARGK